MEEKLERKIDAWLRDRLVPRLAAIFNESCEGMEYTVTRPSGSFFLSDLFFLDIRFAGEGRPRRRVLLKLPSQNPSNAAKQNYDQLFANEIVFYERIINGKNPDYPEYILGGEDPVFGRFIVLENVCQYGYYVCPKKVNIPLDYIAAGLKAMARFHGNTYTMKEQHPEKFQQILKDVIKFRYDEDAENKTFVKECKRRAPRPIRVLRSRGYDPDFTKQVAYLFEDSYHRVLLKCVRPVEPLATIVHGDTTINNILYRKLDNKRDGCLQAMLIDFAMTMYSSPATDVSTLVYMTGRREDIKEHTEELIKIYHDNLADYLKERGIWNPSKYSYDAFWQDYKRCAIFGYLLTVYFLPMMTEYERNNDILQLDDEQVDEINMDGGGEALSNLLADMLIDMRAAGLLDCYVNNNNAGKLDVCHG